ncbi:MAG: three-Cys-motif partner protein TcmP, partial [Nitrospira sp.]|nr:three-Cys-motif partner protein TcmP [Nitrospira sp.]
LEKLLSIIGMTGKAHEIVYVDCFAGPWGNGSESLSGTSIAISLEILRKVKETLEKVHQMADVKFRAIYIEEMRSSHKKLSIFLEKHCPEGIECHALHGDYLELQDEILQLCGDRSFVFFFIDPKGWKDVGIQKLTKLLRRPRSEFLITFMYDFFNRAIRMVDLRQQVHEVLGELTHEDYLQISSLTGKEREEIVVRKYRQQLKDAMGPDGTLPSRSYHAVILNKEKDRTHYHMVYLTRHHKGIVKFAESSEKVDRLQRVVRIQMKRDTTSQTGLFSAEEEAQQQNGARAGLEDVKGHWLEHLTVSPIIYDEARLADMLEDTGWLIRDFQEAFGVLLAEGIVENLDDPGGRRRRRFVHFESGDRLRRRK